MDGYTTQMILITVGLIFGMLLATHFVGAYVAMVVFLILYMGVFGGMYDLSSGVADLFTVKGETPSDISARG